MHGSTVISAGHHQSCTQPDIWDTSRFPRRQSPGISLKPTTSVRASGGWQGFISPMVTMVTTMYGETQRSDPLALSKLWGSLFLDINTEVDQREGNRFGTVELNYILKYQKSTKQNPNWTVGGSTVWQLELSLTASLSRPFVFTLEKHFCNLNNIPHE